MTERQASEAAETLFAGGPIRAIDRERSRRIVLAVLHDSMSELAEVLQDTFADDTGPNRMTALVNTVTHLALDVAENYTAVFGKEEADRQIRVEIADSLRATRADR